MVKNEGLMVTGWWTVFNNEIRWIGKIWWKTNNLEPRAYIQGQRNIAFSAKIQATCIASRFFHDYQFSEKNLWFMLLTNIKYKLKVLINLARSYFDVQKDHSVIIHYFTSIPVLLTIRVIPIYIDFTILLIILSLLFIHFVVTCPFNFNFKPFFILINN